MKTTISKCLLGLVVALILGLSATVVLISNNKTQVNAESIDDIGYCWYVPEYFNNDYNSNYHLPIIESNDTETARKNGILRDDYGDPFIFEFVDRYYIFYLMGNGGWSSDIPSPIPTVPYYFMISIYQSDDAEYIYIDLICLNLVDDNYVYLDYLTFDYISYMENTDLGYSYLANYGTYNVYYPQYPMTLSKLSYNNGVSNDIKTTNLPSYLSIYNNKHCGLLSNLTFSNNPLSYSLLIDSSIYTPFFSYPTNLNASYDSGYDEGYSVGVYSGYSQGYNEGQEIGYENGYNAGYDTGELEGFSHGYRQAVAEIPNNISSYNNLLSSVWAGASSFLNTQVLGNLTIMHLILIPLLLGMLLIILKLIRG